MFQTALVIILVLHSLIHLMGVAKAFGLGRIEQLSKPISRREGFFWILTFLLLAGAAFAFLVQWQWWWIIVTLGVVLSQILIFNSWKDAKAGTVANAIIALCTLLILLN